AMNTRDRIRKHYQAAVRVRREFLDSMLDVIGIAHRKGRDLHAERWRGRLDLGQLSSICRTHRVVNNRHAGHAWRKLLEQFQPFYRDRVLVKGESRYVAAGVCEARNEAAANRVADLCEYNRDGSGRLRQLRQGRSGTGDDHVRFRSHQLSRIGPRAIDVGAGPVHLDADIVAIGPAEPLESIPERRDPELQFGISLRTGDQETDPPYPLALLRARRERPRCRADECG